MTNFLGTDDILSEVVESSRCIQKDKDYRIVEKEKDIEFRVRESQFCL